MKHKFKIGTEFLTNGKHPKKSIVVDQLTTTNSTGEVVAIRYVTQHEFCGQLVKTNDTIETTIARGACKLQGVNSVAELKL